MKVVFSIDDIHPAPAGDAAFDRLRWLQARHPQLKATLFTTADWRAIDPFGTETLPAGTYRLDRHPRFCDMLRDWPNVELALHGLHHVPLAEFADLDREHCRAMLQRAMTIFDDAGLPFVRGLCPPAWHATDALLDAMRELDFRFVASARDLTTPIDRDAVTNGSGLRGVPLIAPARLGSLLHFATNFQASSTLERAFAILDAGGLLAIKAHLLTEAGTYRAMDGLASSYAEELDQLFCALEDRYGAAIDWTTMGAFAL